MARTITFPAGRGTLWLCTIGRSKLYGCAARQMNLCLVGFALFENCACFNKNALFHGGKLRNQALAAHFALASWFGFVAKRHSFDSKVLERLLSALAADSFRRVVQLSFTGCRGFTDAELSQLLRHLPRQIGWKTGAGCDGMEINLIAEFWIFWQAAADASLRYGLQWSPMLGFPRGTSSVPCARVLWRRLKLCIYQVGNFEILNKKNIRYNVSINRNLISTISIYISC